MVLSWFQRQKTAFPNQILPVSVSEIYQASHFFALLLKPFRNILQITKYLKKIIWHDNSLLIAPLVDQSSSKLCSIVYFFSVLLVLFQFDIAGFSEFVSVYGKARLAGNSCSITQRHNAVHGRWQTHPQGATLAPCNCVAALRKGNNPFLCTAPYCITPW